MRIGELGDRTGVSAKALRFYEAEGLLPEPARTPSGYRDYGPDAVERVDFIRDAQAAGLALRQIRTVLDVRDGGEAPCDHVGAFVSERLAEVEERIAELDRTRARLQALAARAAAVEPEHCDGICTIIERA